MPEIVTTGAALIGAGSWFLNKVLGPSADELGGRLRIYVADRLDKVFQRAEKDAQSKNLKLNPVPPAFAIKFYQEASLSEDDDAITEMWSNLLLDASGNFSHRHNLYVSILSQLGSQEAMLLNSLVPSDDNHIMLPYVRSVNATAHLQQAVFGTWEYPAPDVERGNATFQEVIAQKLPYPGRVLAADWAFKGKGGELQTITGGSGRDQVALDILARQALLEPFHFVRQGYGGQGPMIEGVIVTSLGVEFVLTCRGAGLRSGSDD